MPTYLFRDKSSNEVTEKCMKISEREAYLQSNPTLETIIQAPRLADSFRYNPNKHVDSGWKERLARIHELTPGSKLHNHSSVTF